jgi:hypothetical protein
VVSEERMVSLERRGKMREELEDMDTRLEEERKRSADLLAQVGTAACLYPPPPETPALYPYPPPPKPVPSIPTHKPPVTL